MKTILLFLCLSIGHSSAAHKALTYEPAVVELTGILDLQTFPGPPGYESIGMGDVVERHFYLKLNTAIDVLPRGNHPTVGNPEKERNVKIVQLAINGEDDGLWGRFRKLGEGGHVKIRGTLFHQFTGHHHSRVLLSVQQMHALEP